MVIAALLLGTTAAPAYSSAAAADTDTGPVGEVEMVPFEAVAEDGTVLRGHVHKPKGRHALATVLTLSPYWNSAIGWGRSARLSQEGAAFVDAGFAFAAVNVRGTGASDGCLQFGDELDRGDAYTVIETLADERWSNGNVGMFGLSYDAWTQYMAIAADPPALKAAVPVSGIVDMWSWMAPGGAPETYAPAWMGDWRTFYSIAPTSAQARPHVDCTGETSADTSAALELVRTGDRSEFFKDRDLRPLLPGSDVAVFTTSGMRHLGEYWHNRHYDGLWKYLNPKRSRFLLGQWGHRYPQGTRRALMEMVLGWFDHYLRGGPDTVRAGVFEFQDDRKKWHSSQTWPPTPVSRTKLFLSQEKLTPSASAVKKSSVSFRSFVADPGSGCGPGGHLNHHALFVSAPVKQSATLAGNFELTTEVRSSLPGGNFAAVLYKTSGDGSCSDVSQNAVEVGRIQLDLQHSKTPGESREFPIGTPTVLRLRSEPLVSSLAHGQRLVLAVGGGSAHLLPDPLQPELTIRTGRTTRGVVELPVIRGRLVF
ncbi:MAG: CocE/NonD family hydrolase [Actinomycetota bacterium]|nr:CocE/NonD family hydrolase [Actinomycetota bacterium]